MLANLFLLLAHLCYQFHCSAFSLTFRSVFSLIIVYLSSRPPFRGNGFFVLVDRFSRVKDTLSAANGYAAENAQVNNTETGYEGLNYTVSAYETCHAETLYAFDLLRRFRTAQAHSCSIVGASVLNSVFVHDLGDGHVREYEAFARWCTFSHSICWNVCDARKASYIRRLLSLVRIANASSWYR